jgi:hypothetical protein
MPLLTPSRLINRIGSRAKRLFPSMIAHDVRRELLQFDEIVSLTP